MTAATATLPTPTITTPFSWYADEKGRSRKATFLITPATEQSTGYAVELSVSHNKSRKEFSAYLQPVTLGKIESGPFTSTSCMLFSGVSVMREQVARFSAKGIEAFLADALKAVEVLAVSNPDVANLFLDPTSPDRMFGRSA